MYIFYIFIDIVFVINKSLLKIIFIVIYNFIKVFSFVLFIHKKLELRYSRNAQFPKRETCWVVKLYAAFYLVNREREKFKLTLLWKTTKWPSLPTYMNSIITLIKIKNKRNETTLYLRLLRNTANFEFKIYII